MLAPNWEDHDLETCPIINHFANRNHAELVLKKLEEKILKSIFTVTNVKAVKHLRSI